MSRVNLTEFKNKDFKKSIDEAMLYLKEHKNSTLVINPGTYVLTTPLAREAQNNVMTGVYGDYPQNVMFKPDYVYDRGFDFDGHTGTTIEAYGVKIIVDGFMETFSIRNCSGVEIKGLTVDTKRKPYSRGEVITKHDNKVVIKFAEEFPINEKMPHMRAIVCNNEEKRFESEVWLGEMKVIGEQTAEFETNCFDETDYGKRVYVWHTYHSRPAFLLENAKNTSLKDVTINSHPGMGITAMHSENIKIDRLKVVPAPGEFMSTNTDAMHIASCRGKFIAENSLFIGMGDDTLNCHTYYQDIVSVNGKTVETIATPPDGTHTQSVDYFEVGDTLQLVKRSNLKEVDLYKVVSTSYDKETRIVTSTLDHEIDVNIDEYLLADKSALPDVSVINCTMKNHYARGTLLKTNKALIKNCLIENLFDEAVKIDPEASWKEGIATTDITVSGCRMINCGRKGGICGGVWVYTQCADPTEKCHGKVTIEKCEINCPKTENALFLKNVKEIVLDTNSLKSNGDLIRE